MKKFLLNSCFVAAFFSAATFLYSNEYFFNIQKFLPEQLKGFEYKNNNYVLSPKEFEKNKGGDCDDFAVYTCYLLDKLGYTSFVGMFYDNTGREGHAFCVLFTTDRRLAEIADTFYTFKYGEKDSFSGELLPMGYYIPIDYGRYGIVTSKPGRFKYITKPSNIIGSNL